MMNPLLNNLAELKLVDKIGFVDIHFLTKIFLQL